MPILGVKPNLFWSNKEPPLAKTPSGLFELPITFMFFLPSIAKIVFANFLKLKNLPLDKFTPWPFLTFLEISNDPLTTSFI